MSNGGTFDGEHNHEIHFPSEITRRALLAGAISGLGATLLGLGESSALATVAKPLLPGFDAFAKSLYVSVQGKYFLVETNGVPNHNMMVGITNWQQQIPVPQDYSGKNAWKIPKSPVVAKTPISAKDNLFRGAIALAVNGVPIFNALNNRGEVSKDIGELDSWGGHCGRADDYHYHAAPLHLSAIVGPKKPIAYALDGFAIYGAKEPDGSPMQPLDELNGHFDAKTKYHYHGTNTYPFINGGMKGVVKVVAGQIDPQPVTHPFRPDGQPLPGASITDFSHKKDESYVLKYTVNGEKFEIDYSITGPVVNMTFINSSGTQATQSYIRN